MVAEPVRMSNAMCLRGMAARTLEAYIEALVDWRSTTSDRRRTACRGIWGSACCG